MDVSPVLRQLNIAGQALTSNCSRQAEAPDWQSQVSTGHDILEQDPTDKNVLNTCICCESVEDGDSKIYGWIILCLNF